LRNIAGGEREKLKPELGTDIAKTQEKRSQTRSEEVESFAIPPERKEKKGPVVQDSTHKTKKTRRTKKRGSNEDGKESTHALVTALLVKWTVAQKKIK